MTPVDIGDTQGTLQAKKCLKHSINAERHLYESTVSLTYFIHDFVAVGFKSEKQ